MAVLGDGGDAADEPPSAGSGDEESQVFLLHPRFESLSIKSEFSAKELEGLDGPRLLRTAFLLFAIQVAWFFCLVALFGAGLLSFELLGARNAFRGAAGVFAFALASQIVVVCLFAGGLHLGIRGVARRDPTCCGGLTHLQVYRYANAALITVVAALCVSSARAIRRGAGRDDTRLGTLVLVVQSGALLAKLATVAVALVVAARARAAFLGFRATNRRPVGPRAYAGPGGGGVPRRVRELL